MLQIRFWNEYLYRITKFEIYRFVKCKTSKIPWKFFKRACTRFKSFNSYSFKERLWKEFAPVTSVRYLSEGPWAAGVNYRSFPLEKTFIYFFMNFKDLLLKILKLRYFLFERVSFVKKPIWNTLNTWYQCMKVSRIVRIPFYVFVYIKPKKAFLFISVFQYTYILSKTR